MSSALQQLLAPPPPAAPAAAMEPAPASVPLAELRKVFREASRVEASLADLQDSGTQAAAVEPGKTAASAELLAQALELKNRIEARGATLLQADAKLATPLSQREVDLKESVPAVCGTLQACAAVGKLHFAQLNDTRAHRALAEAYV